MHCTLCCSPRSLLLTMLSSAHCALICSPQLTVLTVLFYVYCTLFLLRFSLLLTMHALLCSSLLTVLSSAHRVISCSLLLFYAFCALCCSLCCLCFTRCLRQTSTHWSGVALTGKTRLIALQRFLVLTCMHCAQQEC